MISKPKSIRNLKSYKLKIVHFLLLKFFSDIKLKSN